MFRNVLFRVVVLASALAGFVSIGLSVPAAQAAVNSYLVSAARESQPVETTGETFFTDNIDINTSNGNVVVAGSSDGTGDFWVDDIAEFDINRPDGTTATISVDDSNNCTATTVLTSPPVSLRRYLQPGNNHVHVIFRDKCGGNDGNSDVYLVGSAAFSHSVPPRRSFIAAGYFNGIVANPSAPKPKNAGSNDGACTAGFAVTQGQVRYMLTANHCRTWLDKNTGQPLDGKFANPVDVVSAADRSTRTVLARAVDCSGSSPRCLRPGKNKAPDDILAWEPDPSTVIPTGFAFTGEGLLSVLGNGDWSHGETVCRFGDTTNHEECGSVGRFDSGSGYVSMTDFDGSHAMPGDSGGPVYAYVRNTQGDTIGVVAIGITEAVQGDKTYFMPIATVLKLLKVQVLTVP